MATHGNGDTPDRLSVSQPKKAPPRELTMDEMATMRRVADALIPSGDGVISGGSVNDFENLVTRAAAILDKTFPQLVAVLKTLSQVPQDDMWAALQKLSADDVAGFTTLSTLVAGAYLYSDEIKAELNYPAPHRNPPDFFDAADELSSGILDQVMASDFTYVAAG